MKSMYLLLVVLLVSLSSNVRAEYKKKLIYDPVSNTYKWVLVYEGNVSGFRKLQRYEPNSYDKYDVKKRNESIKLYNNMTNSPYSNNDVDDILNNTYKRSEINPNMEDKRDIIDSKFKYGYDSYDDIYKDKKDDNRYKRKDKSSDYFGNTWR